MKNLVYLSLAALLIVACSKDQKAVNNLEGSWVRTGLSYDGVTIVDTTGTTYSFEKCKVKKADCPGTMTSDGKSFPFTYNFADKGETFTITLEVLGIPAANTGSVIEQSSSKFVFNYTDTGGVLVQETLTK